MNLEQNHDLMIWALIIVSISLVTGITYVYTNRNRRVTLLFTLLSICFVFLLKIISIVDVELDVHFLGEYHTPETPTVIAGPGWGLLLHAWHIWILPVAIVCFVFVLILYLIMLGKQSTAEKLEVRSPLSSSAMREENKSEQTRSERLNALMMIDAAKKQSRIANQKLTESLLANASYEIKINELNARITTLEEDLQTVQKSSIEQLETLQAELNVKKEECESLDHQLSSTSQDLEKAKELLKKLSGLSKKRLEE